MRTLHGKFNKQFYFFAITLAFSFPANMPERGRYWADSASIGPVTAQCWHIEHKCLVVSRTNIQLTAWTSTGYSSDVDRSSCAIWAATFTVFGFALPVDICQILWRITVNFNPFIIITLHHIISQIKGDIVIFLSIPFSRTWGRY